jgi:hypothetical protein
MIEKQLVREAHSFDGFFSDTTPLQYNYLPGVVYWILTILPLKPLRNIFESGPRFLKVRVTFDSLANATHEF